MDTDETCIRNAAIAVVQLEEVERMAGALDVWGERHALFPGEIKTLPSAAALLRGQAARIAALEAIVKRDAASALRTARADALREAAAEGLRLGLLLAHGKHQLWTAPIVDGAGDTRDPDTDDILDEAGFAIRDAILALIDKPAAHPAKKTGTVESEE